MCTRYEQSTDWIDITIMGLAKRSGDCQAVGRGPTASLKLCSRVVLKKQGLQGLIEVCWKVYHAANKVNSAY